jgi:rsbT co-antagonist protein RsbR
MADTTFPYISLLLQRSHEAIRSEWLGEVMPTWNRQYPGLLNENDLGRELDTLLRELSDHFSSVETKDFIAIDSNLAEFARQLSIDRAKKGIKPIDTSQYMIALKNTITKQLVTELSSDPVALIANLRAIDDVLDRLSMLTFEAFVEARERIIAQQSLSLLELSTPVVLLWNHVLMLPLVGVIDTLRARHFTERMLAAISQHEATVTIIDVTGVPVFDTSVARHIMKAVDAAQLLGSRIIMTGISPEGAQTLTKLGIGFSNVISRATLRAGFAEALQIIGRRVVGLSTGERS